MINRLPLRQTRGRPKPCDRKGDFHAANRRVVRPRPELIGFRAGRAGPEALLPKPLPVGGPAAYGLNDTR